MFKNALDFLRSCDGILKVLQEPHPLLREISTEVKDFSGISELVEKMKITMKEEGGIGLAAPQVGFCQRLFVIHIFPTETRPETSMVVINPKIVERKGSICLNEGCLSVEGKTVPVKRARVIEVQYQDEKGILHHKTLEDLAAVCFQHENDHLDGILISDFEIKDQ